MRNLKIESGKLTNRTENVSRYFTEVERNPLLSPDQEFEIGMLAKDGDEEAISKLIKSNLRFVVSVAKQYSGARIPLEELICQGNIGLCDAARTFDPTRGFRFISYAVWHIRKEILAYLTANSRVVRVPANILNDLAKIKRADETVFQENGRYGTAEEIEEILSRTNLGKEISAEQIKKVKSADSTGIPLESNDPDAISSPIDWIESDSNTTSIVDREDLTETIDIALSRLTPIQRDIVERRLGIGHAEAETFSTIGERYGRTSEWVRTTYVKSLKIMRSRLNRANLGADRVLNCEI